MKNIKWVGLVLAVTLSGALAEINVRFDCAGPDILRFQTLMLSFAVGESGVVSMDASTLSTEPRHIQAVDAWDSPNVGQVDPSLAGSTFALTGEASRFLSLRQNDGGVLGVVGKNAGRIDDNGCETIIWTFSDGGAGLTAHFQSLFYGNAQLDQNTAIKLVCGGITKTYNIRMSPLTYGMVDVGMDGFFLFMGDSLIMTTEESTIFGYGLSGFTLNVTAAAPISVGMRDQNEWAPGPYRRG